MRQFRKSDEAINDSVDTYLLNDILPGFLWIIPINNNEYRVGLFSKHSHKQQDEILTNFLNQNFRFEIRENIRGSYQFSVIKTELLKIEQFL